MVSYTSSTFARLKTRCSGMCQPGSGAAKANIGFPAGRAASGKSAPTNRLSAGCCADALALIAKGGLRGTERAWAASRTDALCHTVCWRIGLIARLICGLSVHAAFSHRWQRT